LPTRNLADESWQVHDVGGRDGLERIAGFAPGAEAAGDYEYFES